MSAAVTMPVVARTRADLAALLVDKRASGDVVLVPTMGALHEGHAGLIRIARERAGGGAVVVSIFVNPLQFGPNEDLDRYPRTFDADLEMCRREGADVVFAPTVDEMYPGGVPRGEVSTSSTTGGAVTVEPGPLGGILEGRTRPGHFRGVLTVVAKLFGLVRPDVAVFGEKDYQQLVLIQQLVADLCISGSHGALEIVGAPTDREDDGLARSSRNRYLDAEQRGQAAALSRVLHAAGREAPHGVEAALTAARAELRTADGVDLDYFVIRAPDLAELPSEVESGTPARALIAARVGTTRLIDNLALTIGGSTTEPTEPTANGSS
ncbi:pantoate--beta-alanine ligase [Nocardioides bizhenqiangii]|uniref:Pantothenate synthetase n=1 Tax=Nocardioides bizhenqiangii TaxID=3095076 RepID=A0ABZ0ZS58_9ACTN|nr:pantoate--beta-alanine ligase [Nocardioides sp. HM61]WQQ26925.1 pantoate--beta-alanine ligase [Nocardioides sp. HM61]